MSIKQKIERVGTPLKDWNIHIYRGILTGLNSAFIITTEKRNEILSNCIDEEERRRTEEIIRPILRGQDIERYGYKWAGLWLINVHNGVLGRIGKVSIDKYPAIKEHLDSFEPRLSSRADQGDTPYNLRSCDYLEEFYKPKIIFQEIVKQSQFAFDEGAMFCNDTSRIITGDNLKHLLGIMNSKLFFFAVKKYYGGGGLGSEGVRMKHTFFEKFCFVDVDNEIQNIVEGILSKDMSEAYGSTIIENRIAILYGLTEEESQYIREN